MQKHILRIACSDEKGLIYRISNVLFENNFNIDRNDEFVDSEKNLFFMRTEFSGDCDVQNLKNILQEILPEDAKINLTQNKVKNVVILVTKEHHCLSDLLIRNEFNEMNFNVLSVIGNYDILKDLTGKFDIPFHYIPAENISREEHQQKIAEILEQYDFDYLVLAKFMRILTPEFVKKFKHKIINIHHSFLPAFIGANPYKQAHERGVKMIGATSHFVTDDLDDGPIIYQDIIKVNHAQNAKDLAKLGKEVEKKVLAEALKLVFNDKVFIDDNKTVIFE
ncbi:formyltetrahydrofolate deformylase [Cloacibacterium sp.]|uniref:formyltetrahydrofolate deformylase n=1 Tax=Cloacibacterium sp. TaxID=1913682 RepID=UPI0039E5109C